MFARFLRALDALVNSVLTAFKKVFWMVVIVAVASSLVTVGVFALAFNMFT